MFVDSNVLGSRTLYDWLFLLRNQSGMFSLVTTPDVLDEAHRVWRKQHPTTGGEMRKNRERIFRESFDEVLEDWAGGAAPDLLDPHDQHVHNAATYCQSHILLTLNGRDFGEAELLSYDLYTPDEFFCLVNSSSPFTVRRVARIQNEYWQGRRDNGDRAKTLASALQDAGCPKFAAIVAGHLQVLVGPK